MLSMTYHQAAIIITKSALKVAASLEHFQKG
jgi:hypothetical protein